MNPRTFTRAAGIVGGASWLARYAMDRAGVGSTGLLDALGWAGLVLLALALAGFGAGLVSSSAMWLQAIVAVAFPLLVWSLLETIAPGNDPSLVDGAFGGAVMLICVVTLRKAKAERAARRRSRRSHGTHAR